MTRDQISTIVQVLREGSREEVSEILPHLKGIGPEDTEAFLEGMEFTFYQDPHHNRDVRLEEIKALFD